MLVAMLFSSIFATREFLNISAFMLITEGVAMEVEDSPPLLVCANSDWRKVAANHFQFIATTLQQVVTVVAAAQLSQLKRR